MSRYLVPFNDPSDDPLPSVSKTVAKQMRKATQNTELEVFKYDLAAWARSHMAQADFEAHNEAGDDAMEKELRLLKRGLADAGNSAAAAEIVGGWVADVRRADQRRFRRFFGE